MDYTLVDVAKICGVNRSTINRNINTFKKLYGFEANIGNRKYSFSEDMVRKIQNHFSSSPRNLTSSKKPIIISIANQKGGVGKTTTAINLSHTLSARLENENILLIEFDPQCNITEKFIPAQFLNRTNNIYDLIESENDPNIELSSTELKEAIFDFSDNFHFIPSSLKLGRADNWKSDELASLHNLLHNPFFTQNYSIIIIDVVPTIGNMLIIPLLASDYVIMPTQAEEMSIQGLQSSINILEKMKKINTELKLFGILVTMTQSNTNIQADEIKNIKDMSENLVFKTTIPRNISVQEAFKRAMFLDQHDMASPASIAYNSLFEEIVERLNNG